MSRKKSPAKGQKEIRCAVYTRKSSEEGLEQEFNSLHAQREACEAFITSQKQEGWTCLNEHYDDGGISGATMDRPALQQLLPDIEAGKVDVVVVYKVDRLTRALSDFAKMLDIFDAHSVSFVSVTQQFNTTSSMGRLTLNVLLSFAQFEREVTGERIRDKIAASKKKGMWMGGMVPLGYDAQDKKLIVNEAEAKTVQHIFRSYAELGSVRCLKKELNADGIVSKKREHGSGRFLGGRPLARGALYHLLQNRIYLGEIVHKETSYPGKHDAIVDQGLWDRVQSLLADNRVERGTRSTAQNPSLLAGVLFDGQDHRLTPSRAVKNGKRYRYYVSQGLIRDGVNNDQSEWRLPASEIETLVVRALQKFFSDEVELFDLLTLDQDRPSETESVFRNAKQIAAALDSDGAPKRQAVVQNLVARTEIHKTEVRIEIDVANLKLTLQGDASNEDPLFHTIVIPAALKQCGRGGKLIVGQADWHQPTKDPALIKTIRRAHRWLAMLLDGDAKSVRDIARQERLTHSYVSRLLPLAFLAPDITKAILEGRHPPELSAERLSRMSDLPLLWAEQRSLLGFNPA